MDNNNQYIESENFCLTINTPTNSVTVPDLLSYLANYELMAKSVNQVLNKNGCLGFDQVVIEIEAFKQGSFDICGKIKKITNNQTFSAVSSTIIGILITKALDTDMSPTMVINNYDGGVVSITYNDLVENQELIKSRSKLARTAVNDPNVKSISIKCSNDNDDIKIADIDINTLRSIIIDEAAVDQNVTHKYSKVRLRIISPVLESEPASWKVSLDDRKISAFMTDEDFLKKMNETKIAFGKGDIIVADLEIVIKEGEKENKSRPKYYIRKVHQYPRYLSNEQKEMTLFDSK